VGAAAEDGVGMACVTEVALASEVACVAGVAVAAGLAGVAAADPESPPEHIVPDIFNIVNLSLREHCDATHVVTAPMNLSFLQRQASSVKEQLPTISLLLPVLIKQV